MGNNFISSIWDFREVRKEQTNYLSHDIFRWYGKLIPQLVKKVVLMYSQRDDSVLANFCGSGTILAEALIEQRNAIGVDSNPLSILISNIKTSKYEFKNVESLTEKIIDASAKKYSHLGIEAKVNISRWFEPLKLRQLLAIKDEIDKFGNEQEKALFQVALAGIVRDASKVDHRCVNHI